jgi:hypothetical protein
MTNEQQPRADKRNKDDFEKQLLAAFERVVARDHPNPNRGGCPSAEQLRYIAEARSKASPEILTHVARCWPCVQDLKRLRRAREKA